MGPYFNEKLSDDIKPGIKTGVNTGIGLNLSDHVVLSICCQTGRLPCIRESMDMENNE